MTSTPLHMTFTKAGLRAVFNAQNNGLQASLSHMALGDAGNSTPTPGAHGYEPSDDRTQLINERQRVALGGGDYLSDYEIMVQALFGIGPTFQIWEAGLFLDDGTLLCVWSDVTTPMGEKSANIDMVAAFSLALQGLPPDSINLTVNGPSVNILIAKPLAQQAAATVRHIRRTVQSENARLIPKIENTWS